MLFDERIKFDLQLFAEDDEIEIEDGGYQGEEEEKIDEYETDEEEEESSEDLENSEEGDGESDEDGGESDEGDETLDKKTKAIIREKKKRKKAEEKLKKLEKQLQEKESQKKIEKKVEEKKNQGYSEEEAKRLAELEVNNEKMAQQLTDFKFKELSSRYPAIGDYKEQILEEQERLPDATLEEIYLAKFFKGSEADEQRLAEQRALYQQSEEKTVEKGEEKGMGKKVKLSPSDERAYKIVKKSHPNISKQDFINLMNTEEIEE